MDVESYRMIKIDLRKKRIYWAHDKIKELLHNPAPIANVRKEKEALTKKEHEEKKELHQNHILSRHQLIIKLILQLQIILQVYLDLHQESLVEYIITQIM